MTYTYYRVLDTNNKIVFQSINNDINTKVYYIDRWWDLTDLISHFIDLEYTINNIDFTTVELNNWLLQRNISKLKDEGYVVNNTSET